MSGAWNDHMGLNSAGMFSLLPSRSHFQRVGGEGVEMSQADPPIILAQTLIPTIASARATTMPRLPLLQTLRSGTMFLLSWGVKMTWLVVGPTLWPTSSATPALPCTVAPPIRTQRQRRILSRSMGRAPPTKTSGMRVEAAMARCTANASIQQMGIHVAPGSEGPVTVADIVRRPIVERRKRPIPRDPSRLVQINAPIPPRRSKRVFTTRSVSEIHLEASTSQAGVEGHSAASDGAANVAEAHEAGLALQRGSKRKYKSSEQVDDAEAKRIRNTLAARRHRLYKATQWKNMQEEQERLRARNAELEEQAAQRPDEAMLTAENRALLSRVRQLEVERQALLVRIEQMEHHMRRTRHPGFY